ncbi:hypothetical protein FRB91_008428 [Serendipita sp. 411]|nr:hypothetical protein FRB91_008428 [Serendipita sp. 411]
MCGRFALGGDRDEVLNRIIRDRVLDAEDAEWEEEEAFYPRYNIAPRTRVPVIRRRPGAGSQDSSEREINEEGVTGETSSTTERAEGTSTTPAQSRHNNMLQTMRWGLVPHYSKSDNYSTTANTINARVETILERGSNSMWGAVIQTNRCLVPAQGYYEWLTKGKSKVPHFVRHPDESNNIYFAGLWDVVTLEQEGATEPPKPLYTFSIVTIPARPEMEWLHDRMPLIFSPTSPGDMERMNKWLDPEVSWSYELMPFLTSYLQGVPGQPFTIYPVPPEVGKVGNESKSFIQPVDQRKDGIKALFAKQKRQKEEPEASTSTETLPETTSNKKRERSKTPELLEKREEGPSTKRAKLDTPVKTPASPRKKPQGSPKKKMASPVKDPNARTISQFFPVSPRKATSE